MNLRENLKSATKQIHNKLDEAIRQFGIFSSEVKYACYLRWMHHLYDSCEQSLMSVEKFAQLPPRKSQLRDLLSSDLGSLGELRDFTQPVLSRPSKTKISKHALTETDWGVSYVMEGSAVGATFLLQAAKVELPAGCQTSFLEQLANDAGNRWKHFVEALREADAEGLEHAKTIAAAQQHFQLAYEIIEGTKFE